LPIFSSDDKEVDMFLSPGASAVRDIPCALPPQSGPSERAASIDDDIWQIGNLPESGRLPAFRHLIDAFDAPDETRLTALAGQIRHLCINDRLSQFNVLLRMNREFLGRHPTAFTEQIAHLPPDERRNAFNRLLSETVLLDSRHSDEHLETLGRQIRWLDEKDRLNGFDGIFRKIELAFGEERRAVQFVSLAEQVPHLENKPMFNRFERTLDKIAGLSEEKQRAVYLGALTPQIENFPIEARLKVFKRIAARIKALGKTQQLADESCIALLNKLKVQIGCLSPYGYNDQLTARRRIVQVATDLSLREPSPQPTDASLPGNTMQKIHSLVALGVSNPVAAAIEVMQTPSDGRHIGQQIAGLMNRYPHAGAVALKAYLELVNALHLSAHLSSEEVQSLLLPKFKEERHLPISAVVASHWLSQATPAFVRTLANSATQNSAKRSVQTRLRLRQSDQHHWQLRMQGSADFYKQAKRGIADLPAAEQDTSALRLLLGNGLIPPRRDLRRIAERLPATAVLMVGPMPSMTELLARLNHVMSAALQTPAPSPAAPMRRSSNPLLAREAATLIPGALPFSARSDSMPALEF
jgi:hypothetical protein